MDTVAIYALEDVKVGDEIMVTEEGHFEFSRGTTYTVCLDADGEKCIYTDEGEAKRLTWITATKGHVVRDAVFKVGDTVRMSAVGRRRYGPAASNPHDILGNLITDRGEAYGDFRYRVKWSNGYENFYCPEHLELAVHTTIEETADVEAETARMSPEALDGDILLSARGQTHGDFSEASVFVQGLKTAMRETPNWDLLNADQKEALEMIVHKMGRALFGQPHFKDHWDDISGYSTLVADRLE